MVEGLQVCPSALLLPYWLQLADQSSVFVLVINCVLVILQTFAIPDAEGDMVGVQIVPQQPPLEAAEPGGGQALCGQEGCELINVSC